MKTEAGLSEVRGLRGQAIWFGALSLLVAAWFVINGYQLRVFDGVARKPINQVNLIEPDGNPSSRIVRGVTFSQNGASVTFDDCPRGRSGCKSGLIAVR